MSQRPTLATRVRKATLSRFVPIIAFVSIAAVLISFGFINYQVTKSHQAHLNEFTATYYRTVDALDDQVASLARNDLIINSLIDYSNRDSYLPVFFRSLTPTNLIASDPEFSIVFTDFEGEIITGNHIESFKEFEQHFEWKEQTLENGIPFLDVGKQGLLVVHPVIYGGTTEGAIALHIKNLSSVLRFETAEYNLMVTDEPNIIYKANNRFISQDTGDTLNISSDISGIISNSKSFPISSSLSADGARTEKPLTVTVVQPYLLAYSDAGWVTGALILVLAIILFSTFFSIQLTSNIASKIINRLRDQIGSARDKQGSFKKVEGTEHESSEIFDLKETFNSVMEELLATTFVKERVEGVIDSLGEMLVVYDLQGEQIMANTAFKSLCLASDGATENSQQSIFPDGFVVPQASQSPKILKHKGHGIDNVRHVSWMRTLYKDTDDNVIGIVLTGVDLTESIELQQELTLKNQAIDEAQTPIIIANATMKGFPITYANRAFEQQTGYTFDEVKDTNCKFLQGENTDPRDIEKISTALSELRPVTTNILNYRKDGSEFYNRLSLTPIHDLEGNVTHFLGFQSDITDQERTKQFLEQARVKAEDSAKLKSEFLASMSHEIRTPMNGILGMLGLLESTQLNKEQGQHVRLAKSSADALLVLINDILDFSKIEAGKLSLERVDFDMANLVAEVASSVTCVAENKQLEVVLDVSEAEHRGIVGDPGRIRQVLNNLIGNAIKFTERGHILISATSSKTDDGNCVYEVAIEDTGVGIPEHRVDAVFDSFSQVDASTTRKFGGTGLGLTICKQLAELMDGDILVESELGKGSRFTLKFNAEISQEQPRAMDFSDLGELTIVHLDATVPCLDGVKRQLSKWKLESSQFQEPEDLLSMVSSQHVDIALISSGIPGLDTNQLCRQIRESSCNQTIKLCMLTRLSDLQNGTDLSSMAVDGYFPKPVTPTELHDTLLSLSTYGTSAIAESNATSEAAIDYSGIRSLLVEDNPINQILAVALLEGLGLQVEVANHGKEALKKLKEDAPYELIFMDCQMPEMDGYETTYHIRNGECGADYQDIPIIAMTANAITGDREKCLDAGMSDYITKPIDTSILEQRIAHWCEATGLLDQSNDPATSAEKQSEPPQNVPSQSDTSNNFAQEAATDIWDAQAALERTIGREDLLCRVIKAYLKDTPSLVDRLSKVIEEKDMEQIAYLAHTIKGASLNISAQQVSNLSALIEADAKAGQAERLAAIASDLEVQSKQLFDLLHSYTELKAS